MVITSSQHTQYCLLECSSNRCCCCCCYCCGFWSLKCTHESKTQDILYRYHIICLTYNTLHCICAWVFVVIKTSVFFPAVSCRNIGGYSCAHIIHASVYTLEQKFTSIYRNRAKERPIYKSDRYFVGCVERAQLCGAQFYNGKLREMNTK